MFVRVPAFANTSLERAVPKFRFAPWLPLLLLAQPVAAQVLLVPSAAPPFRQKFDLQVPDAQYLLVPQAPGSLGEGPFRFRFVAPALNQLLERPTVHYVTARDGGVALQVLHLRAAAVPDSALGPQEFEVLDAAGKPVGRGTLLVLARLPEAEGISPEHGEPVLEVGRAEPVRIRIRTHGNLQGEPRVLNPRDWELAEVRPEPQDSAGGMLVLRGYLRARRAEPGELRLAVQTVDGRTAELAFPALPVRMPAPRRVRVSGGPVYLDASGRGSGEVVISGFPEALPGSLEIASDPAGELRISDTEWDPRARTLRAQVEFVPRGARAAGAREVREVVVQSGMQSFRGYLELVGNPVVAGARTDRSGTQPTLVVGGEPALLRISGQNLDGLRLDCSPLGSGVTCSDAGSTPTELVQQIALRGDVPEGELLLPLVATGARARSGGPGPIGVRVRVERPSVPAPLEQRATLRLLCERLRRCRPDRTGEFVVVRADEALQLRLLLDDAEVGAEHGWQKLVVSVTRVRGDQRQTVRSFGTPGAPRLVRQGSGGGELAILDAGADPRHGDVFVVRVEHAVEQYSVEHRSAPAAGEAWVRRVYVDGGLARRITGDIAVQPVLFALGGETAMPMYPNAGFGVTWQPLNGRLEPRLLSTKLQLLATNIKNVGSEGNASRGALFLSGNLRIPGTDPARPLVLTGGVAHMLGGEDRWRLLAGAGVDLGVARMIFGG